MILKRIREGRGTSGEVVEHSESTIGVVVILSRVIASSLSCTLARIKRVCTRPGVQEALVRPFRDSEA
jgi:hypothetical protein